MFDSPFERCNVCGQYVLLDQTQRQCAREHGCTARIVCPLRDLFTGVEFGGGRRVEARPRTAGRRRVT